MDPRLNERILSAEPIENWQEVIRDSFDDHDLRAPGGESAREVLGRAWAALDEILAERLQIACGRHARKFDGVGSTFPRLIVRI